MDIKEKLDIILKNQGWTRYRLAKESGIPESTLTNIFHRKTTPSIGTLATICSTLDITLAEFFAERQIRELTPEMEELYNLWSALNPEKRKAIINIMQLLI